MSTNRIGFNNFKAFGEKMQTFSKKPITLIYGPNSIGKSSLLQSQLILSNYMSVRSSSLLNNNFAGDELDIGDFTNYIHKHDTEKKISYLIELKEKESIASFLNIKSPILKDMIKLYDNKFFDQEITTEQIVQELDSDSINMKIKRSSLDDYLKRFIELSNSIEVEKIFEKFYVYQYILNIEEIKIILKFGIGEKQPEIEFDIIDNLDYEGKEESDKIKNKIRNMIISRESIDMKDTLGCVLKTVQYFGPLRPYPKRKDMFQFRRKKNIDKKSFIDMIDDTNYIKDLQSRYDKLSKYKLGFLRFLDPKFIKFIYKSGAFNVILPDSKKQVFNGSATAHQLWLELINNKELQTKMSNWLSDKDKLKSTYEIRVDKSKVNYMDTVRPWDKDILNDKAKDPIYKAIHFFDDIVEKVLIKIFKRPPSYLNELKFIDTRTDTEVTPRDMGLGISQVLPILISTFTSKKKSLYLEQPELHLHPAVQMEVMDEFIRSAKENDNVFMIETHSEHLLLRIMKRMRYTAEDNLDRDKSLDLTPDDVCLLYVDNDGESTYIQELRLSAKGKLLDHWPNGFFEEGFKERFS